MSFLKREHAPITGEAWKGIDDAARNALRTSLKGRRFVDVSEPNGLSYSALGLGRLTIAEKSPVEEVEFGMRVVRPLVETRTRFELDVWELDNLSRGAPDVDLDAVEDAARRAATFEDRALLLGLDEAGIDGLADVSPHEPIELRHEADALLDALSSGMLTLERAAIGGPFALVVGTESFRFLASAPTGYPLIKRAGALLGGPILESELLEGGLLVSLRGDDFRLTLGQDFSVGYEAHDGRKLRLFLTESFTFHVMEPRAVARFTAPGGRAKKKS